LYDTVINLRMEFFEDTVVQISLGLILSMVGSIWFLASKWKDQTERSASNTCDIEKNRKEVGKEIEKLKTRVTRSEERHAQHDGILATFKQRFDSIDEKISSIDKKVDQGFQNMKEWIKMAFKK